MIPRDAATRLKQLATLYPVVTVTGPRQSGKTTLCRATFPDLPYVSLEPLDIRDEAVRDPRGFLASLQAGAVLDEVQRVPELVSYLQPEVDSGCVGRSFHPDGLTATGGIGHRQPVSGWSDGCP